MSTKHHLLEVLKWHIGAAYGVPAQVLANRLDVPARRVRQLVVELRLDGHHVCADPEKGYFLAATAGELDNTCKFLYSRAMTSLSQISKMRGVAMPDLKGQLRLPT